MRRQVLPLPEVKKALRDYVTVELNAWKARDLAVRLRVNSTPTFTVLRPNGSPVLGTMGYLSPEQFIRFLQRASETDESAS